VKARTQYLLGIVIIVASTIPFFIRFKDDPNAETITMRHIIALVQEAREFRSKVGRNAHSLSDLIIFSPLKPTNRLVDGWGHEFRIEVAEDGGIKLFSNGEDSKPGGAGDMGTFLPP
jgi:hypothetical protein